MVSITLEDLTKYYDSARAGAPAVDAVNLHIEPGELFFLLGPSGCGKTTLLRMIAGLHDPTSGRLLFGWRDVTHLSVDQRNTALVFQNYALWPHMTVQQNVEFGPKMRGVQSGDRDTRVDQSLRRVEMEPYTARKPNQLSGGQQQRVAVARALAAEPDVLLLDEPLSNLDARLRLHMRNQLRQLVKATGTTGIYVTHDQKEALSMADRIAVMNAGKIVQVGTPEELYDRPGSFFVADFLGEANFLPGRFASGGSPAQVATAAGTVAAESIGFAPADGAEVTCCVRPERLELLAADAPAGQGRNALPATVKRHTFLGEIRQYLCELADGTQWRSTRLTAGETPHEVGASVQVAFAPAAVVVLPDRPPAA